MTSKVIVGLHVGGRTQQDAHRLVHETVSHLALSCTPVFSSDGLRQYFYALTAHFGRWVRREGKRGLVWGVSAGLLYGQLRKVRAGYRLKRTYTRILCGTRACAGSLVDPFKFSGRIILHRPGVGVT